MWNDRHLKIEDPTVIETILTHLDAKIPEADALQRRPSWAPPPNRGLD